MPPQVDNLVLFGDALRRTAMSFCTLIEANNRAIELNDVAAVCNLVKAEMAAIQNLLS